MSVNVKHSGAYLESTKSSVKSGTHKPTKDTWIKVNGVYQKASGMSLQENEVYIKGGYYRNATSGADVRMHGYHPSFPVTPSPIVDPLKIFDLTITVLYIEKIIWAYNGDIDIWFNSRFDKTVSHRMEIAGLTFDFMNGYNVITTEAQYQIIIKAMLEGTVVKYTLL